MSGVTISTEATYSQDLAVAREQILSRMSAVADQIKGKVNDRLSEGWYDGIPIIDWVKLVCFQYRHVKPQRKGWTMKRVSSQQVAKLWVNGKAAQNSNKHLYSEDGDTLHSYGEHYVVAHRLPKQNIVLVNTTKASSTTSKHCSLARKEIPANQIVEVEDLTSKLPSIIERDIYNPAMFA